MVASEVVGAGAVEDVACEGVGSVLSAGAEPVLAVLSVSAADEVADDAAPPDAALEVVPADEVALEVVVEPEEVAALDAAPEEVAPLEVAPLDAPLSVCDDVSSLEVLFSTSTSGIKFS